MRRFGLILAGAALFDLGTVVASGQAEVSLNFTKIKIDYSHSVSSCLKGGGTLVKDGGQAFCQTPKSGAPAPVHFTATVTPAPGSGAPSPSASKIKLTDALVSSRTDAKLPGGPTTAPARKEGAK
jgi:hypothetical protein